MFWRILRQLFRASRGRLAVALIALASGAAVTTALVNLHFDAERKLGAEFRALGANVIILPQDSAAQTSLSDPLASPLMDESVMDRLARSQYAGYSAPFLYVVASVDRGQAAYPVVVAGTWLDQASQLSPWWKITGQPVADRNDTSHCLIGRSVAKQLNLAPGSQIELRYGDRKGERTASLVIAGVVDSGGQEDNQVLASLSTVQKLADAQGRVGLIKMRLPGTLEEFSSGILRLSAALPGFDVRPIPQITQAEGQLLPRIQGLIYAMVALILVLTALCVFATMAALAMERRRDVGLMKAIGGKMSRVVAIFLTEAGALGLAGALIGYVVGIFLSRWIGWRAFGVAIDARLEVLPLVVALMVGVALTGAIPLRLLGRVRPAEILRGE